jgi:hypothetical protein
VLTPENIKLVSPVPPCMVGTLSSTALLGRWYSCSRHQSVKGMRVKVLHFLVAAMRFNSPMPTMHHFNSLGYYNLCQWRRSQISRAC